MFKSKTKQTKKSECNIHNMCLSYPLQVEISLGFHICLHHHPTQHHHDNSDHSGPHGCEKKGSGQVDGLKKVEKGYLT